MHKNETRNQHFLSRTEQALNALNPNATGRNKRIYVFEVVDRERNVLRIEGERGASINSNLSYDDLFSFDVPGGENVRMNFERQFQSYERSVELHTSSLLKKLRRGSRAVESEVASLFAAKLLNFVRNPYSIQKVLNTFPGVTSYTPTDKELLATYRKVVDGRKPHQAHICQTLGVSDAQYVEWLRLLFMLLVPLSGDRPNFFDEMVRGLLQIPGNIVFAYVCDYDNAACLLSDRGFSQPLPDELGLSFGFNLCSNAFVNFIFCDPAKVLPASAGLDMWKQASSSRRYRTVEVSYQRNHLDLLTKYNQDVIYQSYRRVFGSSKQIHLGQGTLLTS
ncbi:hypothetical protein [Rhizobium leguminosarum]|uniref:hypothetical protein n=1 Tax=Rhizobium leguminosarum TaxID=384 RepID=UPI001441C617|nr:hypothetical protein [Rhizobium leguminosarum]NKL63309.1 hypothetical protein [Rhizobium leguminosarum bv. viciae]